MRLCLDFDGVITTGRYLPEPRTKEAYASLEPFESDLYKILEPILVKHDCFIITGRSEEIALDSVLSWLDDNYISAYVPIITNPNTNTSSNAVGVWKYKLCRQLGIDLVFDDNPSLYEQQYPDGPTVYLVDNPGWEKNQKFPALNKVKSWKEINEVINNFSASEPR